MAGHGRQCVLGRANPHSKTWRCCIGLAYRKPDKPSISHRGEWLVPNLSRDCILFLCFLFGTLHSNYETLPLCVICRSCRNLSLRSLVGIAVTVIHHDSCRHHYASFGFKSSPWSVTKSDILTLLCICITVL